MLDICIATYEQQNCLHVCRHVAHFVHVYAAYAIFFPDALSRVKTCKMIAVNENYTCKPESSKYTDPYIASNIMLSVLFAS